MESENLFGQIKLNRSGEIMLEKTIPSSWNIMWSSQPKKLLCQGTTTATHLTGIGRIYVQTVVDSHCSYGFTYVHTEKIPANTTQVLHNESCLFSCSQELDFIYRERKIMPTGSIWNSMTFNIVKQNLALFSQMVLWSALINTKKEFLE